MVFSIVNLTLLLASPTVIPCKKYGKNLIFLIFFTWNWNRVFFYVKLEFGIYLLCTYLLEQMIYHFFLLGLDNFFLFKFKLSNFGFNSSLVSLQIVMVWHDTFGFFNKFLKDNNFPWNHINSRRKVLNFSWNWIESITEGDLAEIPNSPNLALSKLSESWIRWSIWDFNCFSLLVSSTLIFFSASISFKVRSLNFWSSSCDW